MARNVTRHVTAGCVPRYVTKWMQNHVDKMHPVTGPESYDPLQSRDTMAKIQDVRVENDWGEGK